MFLDFLTSILCDVRFICSSCRVAIPDVSMSIKPTIVKHTKKKKKKITNPYTLKMNEIKKK